MIRHRTRNHEKFKTDDRRRQITNDLEILWELKKIMTKYSPLRTSESEVRPAPNSRFSKLFFILLCFAVPVFIIYVNSLQNWTTRVDERMIQDFMNDAAADPNFASKYRNKDDKLDDITEQDNDKDVITNDNSVNDNDKGVITNDVIDKNIIKTFITGETENKQNEIDSTTNELKYILLWTPKDAPPFDYLGNGQNSFIKNKCEFTNCFVTPNRRYFGGNITRFDAIAFNGRNMRYTREEDLPRQRSPHQKYIFINLESSTYQPVCNPWYDNFYNWTSSYKLDSDIVYSYIYIRDKDGIPVGPRVNMEWVSDMKEVDDSFKEQLKSKTKAAAWFVSHCITRSKREKYVKLLQNALEPFGFTVDVYGRCGPLICYGSQAERCNAMVKKDYYFYLSFENAFAEDYVTEKLLTALNNDAVPIVYGGSNYSRFLPPGSYLNARDYNPEELAPIMADIITNSTKYHEFFRWKNHYSYSESERVEDVCNWCAALNDKKKVLKRSVYQHFRSWWNPNWEERCQDENWST